MRTQDQVVDRIRKTIEDKDDFFSVKYTRWIVCLDYEHAQSFLGGRVEEIWNTPEMDGTSTGPHNLERESVLAAIIDYMPFAWEKANDCKGLSANRSMDHMKALLWLYDDELLYDRIKFNCYKYYGKPQLRRICIEFGFDWKALDNGSWKNTQLEEGVDPDTVPV